MQFCESIRQQYGLTMTVLVNDRGQLGPAGLENRHTHFLLKQGGEIVYRGQFGGADAQIDSEIRQLLSQ